MNKHLKVAKIEKKGKILEIWVKGNYKKLAKYFEIKFNDECTSFLGTNIDVNQKYVILQFILRNKEDIEPYLDSNIEKVLSKLAKQKEVLDKIKEYINRTEINSVGKPLAYTEIGKELLEILEEIK